MDFNKYLKNFGLTFVFIGATLTVPVGMSALCPYCGRKVRIDASGDVK